MAATLFVFLYLHTQQEFPSLLSILFLFFLLSIYVLFCSSSFFLSIFYLFYLNLHFQPNGFYLVGSPMLMEPLATVCRSPTYSLWTATGRKQPGQGQGLSGRWMGDQTCSIFPCFLLCSFWDSMTRLGEISPLWPNS